MYNKKIEIFVKFIINNPDFDQKLIHSHHHHGGLEDQSAGFFF